MRRLLLLLWLAACGIGLDAHETDSRDDVDGEIGLYTIEPNWGHPDKDTLVTLTGWGFDGELSVQFGNTELTVTRISDDELLITAPAIGFETSIDVKVVSEAGAYKEPNGFTYAYTKPFEETDTDTDSDTDSDTDTDGGSGDLGGLVHLSRTQIACKECFGLSQDFLIEASTAFHAPSNTDFLAWQPDNGSCQANAAPNTANTTRYDVGEWVYLNSGSTSLGLRRTSDPDGTMYSAANLGLSDFISNASYDLQVNDGGELGGPFEISNALITPQGFSNIQPQQLLMVSSLEAFTAPISASGTQITWAPYGGTGNFMIQVDAYDPSGATYLGNVVCMGPDNGAMYLPGSYFTGFYYGSLLAVKMYRQQVEYSLIPATGDTLMSISHAGVWGTAILTY